MFVNECEEGVICLRCVRICESSSSGRSEREVGSIVSCVITDGMMKVAL